MPSYSKKIAVPGKSAQELYDVVARDIDRFMTKASIGKFEIERDAAARQVKVKSSMLTATLFCEENQLRLEGQLSLLAAPFKSKIDEGIAWWLGKAFPELKA